ncbi:peroxiredoxin [Candidatus Pacearchaeota archaeon CG10_big_fil_rev_8_21_14_0_10_32_14]|nr:MAG: peroxiredoxin [Candidatus Pacearchaeota archaeon CG10_big_fil_rev_8_21_14_0_10_32_14]
MPRIDSLAPDFEEEAYFPEKDEIKRISLSDYRGKWVVLFFYPADFTFVCPTELSELANHYETFKSLNTEIISVSTDRAYVHKAWTDASATIKKIKFPMLADNGIRVSKMYGTFIEEDGEDLRATFIIDPEGYIKAYEFHNNDIGRNIHELIRKLQAAQFVKANKGLVCPMNWTPGSKVLTKGLDLVGKI